MVLSINGCATGFQHTQALSDIDKILNTSPAAALDSLLALDVHSMGESEKAYYNLLFTIAQHKNGIPFIGDSAIAASRQFYLSKTNDHYSQARSLFYDGLVLYMLSSRDTLAYKYMQLAKNVMDDYSIEDDRLKALLSAYLGRINEFNGNYERAASYYQEAISIERRQGNIRNELLDYCDLLICLSEIGDAKQAGKTYTELNTLISFNPTIKTGNIDNAKAIYFLHCTSQLDSALYYCLSWKPSSADLGAKNKMLATIYQKKTDWENAVFFEKAAYEQRRKDDKAEYHIYYRNLANLYGQLGDTDSTAHYAQLAYKALHDSFEQKTEKRILELEKQYDVASREAALERERRVRNIVLLMLAFVLVVAALLYWQWRLMRRNEALRHREALKDAVAKSVVNAVVATYSGINKRLGVIHNLPEKERQDALNRFIQENKTNVSRNLLVALEANYNDLPEDVRQVDALLDGAQQRTVFILTEMGFGPGEIGKMLGISSSQVRTVKKAVRDRIVESDLPRHRSICQLQVMQVGTPVRKKE